MVEASTVRDPSPATCKAGSVIRSCRSEGGVLSAATALEAASAQCPAEEAQLAADTDRLGPAEYSLNQLAPASLGAVSPIPGSVPVNRAVPSALVSRHMQSHAQTMPACPCWPCFTDPTAMSIRRIMISSVLVGISGVGTLVTGVYVTVATCSLTRLAKLRWPPRSPSTLAEASAASEVPTIRLSALRTNMPSSAYIISRRTHAAPASRLRNSAVSYQTSCPNVVSSH